MIVTKDSHLDHALTPAQIEHIQRRFADRSAFFIESFEMPVELGVVPCGLYGPAVGDDPVPEDRVEYHVRGERTYASRVLVGAATRPTRTVTVIAGPHGGDACVLYTAFGGPLAPREPGDPALDVGGRAASEAFWARHALALTNS